MWRKLCTRVKTFKVVYYKHIVVINHTRCDTVHLETLVNIGDVGNLDINTQKLMSIRLHAKVSNC